MSSFNWADAEDDEEFHPLPQETTQSLSSTQANSTSAPTDRSRQTDSSAWRRAGFSSSSSSDRYSHAHRPNVQEPRGYVSRNSNINRCNYESRFEGRPPNQCPEGEKPFVLHLSADRLRSKDDVTRTLTQFIRYPYAFESMTRLSDQSVPTWELVFSQWRSLTNAYNVSLQDATISAQIIGEHNQQLVHDYFHGPPPVIKPIDKPIERGFASSAFGGFRGDRNRDAAPMFTPEPEPEADERLLAWARRRAAEPAEPAPAPRGSGYRDGERRERSGFGFRGENSERSGSGHASVREGERERVGAGKTEQATSWRQTPREDGASTGSTEGRDGEREHSGEGSRAGVMGGRAVRVLQREQVEGDKDKENAQHGGTGARGGMRGRGDRVERSERGDRGAASAPQAQANTSAHAAALSWRRASMSEEAKKGDARDGKEARDTREGKGGREGRERDGKGTSRPDKGRKAEDKTSGDEEGSGEGKGRRRRHHARGDRGLGRGRSDDHGDGHTGPNDGKVGKEGKDGDREGKDAMESRNGRNGDKNDAMAAPEARTGKIAGEGGSDRSRGRFGKPSKHGQDVKESKDGKGVSAAITVAEASPSAPQEREKRGERHAEDRTESRSERRREEEDGAFPRSRGYRGRGRGRAGEERK